MSLTRMSRKTGIPVSTLFNRIKGFSGDIIIKHTCLLDFHRLGYSTSAKVIIKVFKDDRDKLCNFLIECPNVNSVSRINNGYDFMIEAVFKDMREAEIFFEDIEERFDVLERQVYYMIEDLKREGFMENLIGL